MAWKIKDFIFCEKSQSLEAGGATVQLEPLQAQVLSYFCEHPDEVISREMLVSAIWPTEVVTDNSVNRIIAKLRKALGDDSQSPAYIATYPRKGYKFIAPVEAYEPPIKGAEQHVVSYKYVMAVAGCLLLLVLAYYVSTLSKYESVAIAALTRGSAEEYDPAMSPDGRFLAYSAMKGQRLTLYVKDLQSGNNRDIGLESGWSGAPSWSHNGSRIVYLFTTERSCELHIVTLDISASLDRKVIHNCPVGSFGKVIFSHDDEKVIYAERPSGSRPYSIYELTLSDSSKRRLTQPDPFFAGNSQFDLHPTKNELLISSPDHELWLNFFSLDLKKDRFTPLFKLDEYVCCAIWNHSGDGVVLMGEQPGYDLIEYSLEGKDYKIIYSAAQQVSRPARHSNGRDYIYVGGISNVDIAHVVTGNDSAIGKPNPLILSATIDDLPALSPQGDHLAFVSDRSGKEEIWLRNIELEQGSKLTSFKDHRHYKELGWSPDGSHIAALALNEIKVIDVVTGIARKLKLPQRQMKSLSWANSHTLTFSVKSEASWYVKSYDMLSDQSSDFGQKWAFVRHGSDPQSTILTNHDGRLFIQAGMMPITLPVLPAKHKHGGFMQLVDGDLYYTVIGAGQWKLMKWPVGSKESKLMARTHIPLHFTVGANGIYMSHYVSNSADIFRTIFR